ncbi:nucleolar protein 14 homolog [Toxorhynchites rutilus septentrionalis]|uniref:nucleolar protein 14 homolog n=1 Tax=Toxorhynchites rutilus septentrionalis TaxID=329112 RepID=UPI00247B06B5|nr:nucleolar protein 14 homolog [Toxorhynchites rutilus septentrionalis]
MAKAKKNRLNSDALLKKKGQSVSKPNAFEIRTTNSKFTILNRDKSANRLTGLPGGQRSRAIEKRKQTLGQEYLVKNKSNKFQDQRKDGKNCGQSIQRQSMTSQRKEMYNLNDSVKLTHRGQTLEEIERFDDAVDNDEDSDDAGQLDADFMEAAHFGGGKQDEDQVKDRKTVIEEMIAESKRMKAEKQRENDELYEMTKKLDQNWQSLIPVVGNFMKDEEVKPKLDDYDRIMREMIFEKRGAPTDKLKSAEQLARIEKENLEKLERERIARMMGEVALPKTKYRSTDDLDDGYDIQPVGGDDGEPAVDSLVDVEDGLYDPRKISKEAERGSESTTEDSDSEEEGEEESEEDDLSDLKQDFSNEEEEEEEVSNEANERKTEQVNRENKVKIANNGEVERKNSREYDELPFIFEIPRRYEDLAELLNTLSPDEQSIILERMIKSNNPKFSHEKKAKMIPLFAFVIQHLNDLFSIVDASTIGNSFRTLDCLTPHLYDLMKFNQSETSACFLEVLKEKQEQFYKRPRLYPALDTLIFLKLIPLLFSASDFRHPIVSPALVFISEMLSRCLVRNRKDITVGMFLVTTTLECVEQSKRLLPAALNFLNGIIYLCYQKRPVQIVHTIPPFKSSAPLNNLLALEKAAGADDSKNLGFTADDFITEKIDLSFKLRALNTTLNLIRNVCQQLNDSIGVQYVTGNFLQNLERIDPDLLPISVKSSLEKTLESVRNLSSKPMRYLVAAEQKPKYLRLLEPKIETVYDDIRRRPKNVKEQRKKLQQKVKKETRAAAREIRQDNEFIAKMQFKQRMASDRDRQERVRRIFNDATMQQGELKSFDRKAKYRK